MTRSFERIARRESILKQKFKMFNPETIYTEHLNFPFCLLAKNYSPKLSQVYMWLQFSRTLLFSKYHTWQSLEVFSSPTFCSHSWLILEFLVRKRSRVLLHNITKHRIHSPASTSCFLEISSSCWVNLSVHCSTRARAQGAIVPLKEIQTNPKYLWKSHRCTHLQFRWWWLKSVAGSNTLWVKISS